MSNSTLNASCWLMFTWITERGRLIKLSLRSVTEPSTSRSAAATQRPDGCSDVQRPGRTPQQRRKHVAYGAGTGRHRNKTQVIHKRTRRHAAKNRQSPAIQHFSECVVRIHGADGQRAPKMGGCPRRGEKPTSSFIRQQACRHRQGCSSLGVSDTVERGRAIAPRDEVYACGLRRA